VLVYVFVEPPQTGSLPVILQVGSGVIVIVLQHGETAGQPLREIVSQTVYVPLAPAVTLRVDEVEEPLIVPLPEIDQWCVTVPPAGVTVLVYVFVEPAQTGSLPVMLQVGIGLTVTVLQQGAAAGQPSRLTVSQTVNVPLAPAVTLIEEPVVEPLMVPLPEIDQL